MDESEKKIMQEDCNEDSIGTGILTLTNKRIAFDKTTGRIADFAKKIGDTVLNVSLNDIIEVGKEGRLMKKIIIKTKAVDGDKTYKFGVYNTGKWLKALQDALAQKS